MTKPSQPKQIKSKPWKMRSWPTSSSTKKQTKRRRPKWVSLTNWRTMPSSRESKVKIKWLQYKKRCSSKPLRPPTRRRRRPIRSWKRGWRPRLRSQRRKRKLKIYWKSRVSKKLVYSRNIRVTWVSLRFWGRRKKVGILRWRCKEPGFRSLSRTIRMIRPGSVIWKSVARRRSRTLRRDEISFRRGRGWSLRWKGLIRMRRIWRLRWSLRSRRDYWLWASLEAEALKGKGLKLAKLSLL